MVLNTLVRVDKLISKKPMAFSFGTRFSRLIISIASLSRPSSHNPLKAIIRIEKTKELLIHHKKYTDSS